MTGSRPTTLDAYTVAAERRIGGAVAAHLLVAGALCVVLVVHLGVLAGLLTIGSILGAESALIFFMVAAGRCREDHRRQRGADPSWKASIARSDLRGVRSHATVDSRDTGGTLGRIYLSADGPRWRAARRPQRQWPPGTSVEVQRLNGLGGRLLGLCLIRLTDPAGNDAVLTGWRAGDLAAHLHAPG